MFGSHIALLSNIHLHLPPQLQISFLSEQSGWLHGLHRTDNRGLLFLELQHFLQLLMLDSVVSVFNFLLGSLILFFQKSEFPVSSKKN